MDLRQSLLFVLALLSVSLEFNVADANSFVQGEEPVPIQQEGTIVLPTNLIVLTATIYRIKYSEHDDERSGNAALKS